MRKSGKRAATIIALICVIAVVVAAAVYSLTGHELVETFWSLVPPLLAIVMALITKEVYSSLFIGVLCGALFYTGFKPIGTVDAIINDGLIGSLADSWDVGVLLFLVMLGILVAVINKAGGSAAFGRWAQRNIKSKVGASIATFFLGVVIFIDDYFNCLTVGSVMRPVADRHKLSRAKFAYLIDATAAPICMIAPISSWACAVASSVEGTAIEESMSGFTLFIRAIPYNFYSLLTIVMILVISFMKLDYGPMRIHERNAENGDPYTTDDRPYENADEEGSDKGIVLDLLLPIILLIATAVVGLLYTGGLFDGETVFGAFENCDASVALPWAALITIIVTFIYYMLRRALSFKDFMDCVPKGFIAMVPAILILSFAWTLNCMTGMLGADVFVAGLMKEAAVGLTNMLPAVIFVVACVLAFATGTSWGTFGILIPIVTAMFGVESELLIIGISACLAGAVCGDHCSPISDTTIMASTGARCSHVNHVSTQLPYALTVAAVSFVSFVISGFVQNIYVCLPVGVALMLLTLVVIKLASPRRHTA